jgi:hemerythrin-like domain-containing protein
MKPTDILKEEHRGIELMLSILERMCRKLDAKERIDLNHLEQALGFLKGFADKCHHMKEENLLFPALEKAGFSKEAGPVAVMLHEHTLGRKYIAAMTEELSAMRRGAVDASPRFVEAARGYSALLTEHIAKEDNVLFPMAEMHLSEDVQSNLVKEFERVERDEIGEGRHEEYHELLKNLKGMYPA